MIDREELTMTWYQFSEMQGFDSSAKADEDIIIAEVEAALDGKGNNGEEWIFRSAGLDLLHDKIFVVTGDGKVLDEEPKPEGWSMYINEDDWMVLLYKDGLPVAGVYTSSRGLLWMSDAYIVATNRMYFASNTTNGWVKGNRNANGIVRSYLKNMDKVPGVKFGKVTCDTCSEVVDHSLMRDGEVFFDRQVCPKCKTRTSFSWEEIDEKVEDRN